MGCIYIIQATVEERTLYKIGMSGYQTPQSRLKIVAQGLGPFASKVYVRKSWIVCNYIREYESHIHRLFNHYYISQEWFDLPPVVINWMDRVQSIDDLINYIDDARIDYNSTREYIEQSLSMMSNDEYTINITNPYSMIDKILKYFKITGDPCDRIYSQDLAKFLWSRGAIKRIDSGIFTEIGIAMKRAGVIKKSDGRRFYIGIVAIDHVV